MRHLRQIIKSIIVESTEEQRNKVLQGVIDYTLYREKLAKKGDTKRSVDYDKKKESKDEPKGLENFMDN